MILPRFGCKSDDLVKREAVRERGDLAFHETSKLGGITKRYATSCDA